MSSGSGGGEPLIVVEESTLGEEEAERRRNESPPRCLDPDSPSLNPYLLSPWRETRKHSLPTPQCTSGITASQVRRLSERGGEGSGPSPREAAFLATLSQAPTPQPGGRRHSVVTISRVPPTLFGRNRRESIAAFPAGAAPRILPGRRDSATGLGAPPSNSGSTHNLQLDIMDDIAEIKAARKVRLKMWKTPSRERVCEVQPLEGNGSSQAQRYTQYQRDRRFSDFTDCSLSTVASLPPSGSARARRASEVPKAGQSGPFRPAATSPAAGIVCSNTDLISILSSLTSSATEINRCGKEPSREDSCKGSGGKSSGEQQRRSRLKSFRSNSFDVSILHGTGNRSSSIGASSKGGGGGGGGGGGSSGAPTSWFIKRHQPMSKKQRSEDSATAAAAAAFTAVTFKDERSKVVKLMEPLTASSASSAAVGEGASSSKASVPRHKVVWDDKSGTKVDAQVLGTAIEEFLTAQRGGETEAAAGTSGGKPAVSPSKPRASPSKVASWFPGGGNRDEEQAESCEPSICSSIKDLFVK